MVVVLVVSAGAAWESPVLELVSRRPGLVVLKRCIDVDDLLAASTAGQADVALAALDAPGLDPSAVDLLHRHQVRLIAVAGAGSPEAARVRATRIGADALGDDADLPGLLDLLESGAERPAEAGEDARPGAGEVSRATRESGGSLPDGRILAVWGPAGAPGRTTLATGIAAVLAGRGHRTTLVDADPHGSSVAQALGVLDEVSGLLSAARLCGEGALEERFGSVQRAMGDQLTVITGLPRTDRWLEVRAGVVQRVLEVARTCGHVVVDTGFSLEEEPPSGVATRPGRNQLTLGALEVADEIVVVGSAEPVALTRLARGLVELRERRPGAPVRVVVNRMRSSLGWSERDLVDLVEGFAPVTGVHFLADDRPAADRAMLCGTTVAESGDSALARGLRVVAEALVPSPSPHRDVGSRRALRVRRRVRSRRADTARRR